MSSPVRACVLSEVEICERVTQAPTSNKPHSKIPIPIACVLSWVEILSKIPWPHGAMGHGPNPEPQSSVKRCNSSGTAPFHGLRVWNAPLTSGGDPRAPCSGNES